jgi:hypothetical protein
MTWTGFEVLRGARELREVIFASQMAGQRGQTSPNKATCRLACVQGKLGPRPWGWTSVS